MDARADELAQVTTSLVRGAELLRRARRRDVVALPGVEPIHLEVLGSLHRCGPMPLTALAQDTATQLSTISRRVSKLEQLGLVAKRAGAADRRVQVAELTGPGRDVVDRIMLQRRALVRRTLARWSPGEVAELARLLGRLADDLEGGELADRNG